VRGNDNFYFYILRGSACDFCFLCVASATSALSLFFFKGANRTSGDGLNVQPVTDGADSRVHSSAKGQFMTQTHAPAVPAPSLFQCIIDWGRRELSGLEGEAATLWNTIEPKLVAEAEGAVGQFLGAAIAAVSAQAPLVLSGSEKFSNAKDLVLEAVEASGRSIGNTLLEFLVNLALALVKTATATSLL
jgi:hypothetical protein